MFVQNKYTKWYFSIIEKAKIRNIGNEKHHIIPRCLGGKDEEDNLVMLTYREHYLTHLLLTKMNDSVKLKNALWQMNFKNKKKYFNSNLYEAIRKEYISRISGDNHWSKSNEFKKVVSESWTPERKNIFKEKVSGQNHWTTKKDMSFHAEKMREKIDRKALSERSKKLFTENNPMKRPEIASKFKKPKEIVTCPFCKKIGGKPVMHRYHFDNCKNK
jgi:hypothetical protein